MDSLKQSVLEIKRRLNTDISTQLTEKKKLIKKYQENIDETNTEIKKLELKIKRQSSFNEDIIILQTQTENALRENSDLEEILKLQEREIKNLSLNNTNLLEEIQKNAFEIEEYKNGSVELDGNIDITQNAIEQLAIDIKNKNENEKKKKTMIEEREKEIRKYTFQLNEVKNEYDNGINYNKKLKNQLNTVKKENSKLNELNDLIQNNKNNKENKEEEKEKEKDKEESFEVKPELNDVEEENLKEIAGLMKNLLEE